MHTATRRRGMIRRVTTTLLFLDVDGVLNGHRFLRAAQSCNIDNAAVLQLNRVCRTTGCKIVLSSAWRYMVHGKSMTLRGFAYMLRTQGLLSGGTELFVGLTEPDETCPACGCRNIGRHGKVLCTFNDAMERVCSKCGETSTRGKQITAWLAAHGQGVKRYAVVDDDAFDFAGQGHPFVQTMRFHGLTRRKADELIRLLGRKTPAS